MNDEILVNVTSDETRVAVLDTGVLQEVYIERDNERGLVGNIYLGKVVRVLPGMQAAFVDIGFERAAFLHARDMQDTKIEGEQDLSDEQLEDITKLLVESQRILVQVTKNAIGTKGPRLTTKISITSRYLVYMPMLEQKVGVSLRIEDEYERDRLKTIVEKNLEEKGGYILRTAAEAATEGEILSNMEYLKKTWDTIFAKVPKSNYCDLIYEDLPLGIRVIRDFAYLASFRIRIDDEKLYQKALEFANNFVPDVKNNIEYYESSRSIFDLYQVEEEIAKAIDLKVPLKSGGYLIIDQREALTTIDVNTGGYVGSRNLEETIFKTNLEAASSIARQLRLRNLGGIIIIDFIDMQDSNHKHAVMATLENLLTKDHAKTKICDVSPLGLVEMTRKRTRESLENMLCEKCPTCSGRGTIKTAKTVCYEIFREILRSSKSYNVKSYLILATAEVIDRLLDEESETIASLESNLKTPIKFQSETLYHQENYDVVIM